MLDRRKDARHMPILGWYGELSRSRVALLEARRLDWEIVEIFLLLSRGKLFQFLAHLLLLHYQGCNLSLWLFHQNSISDPGESDLHRVYDWCGRSEATPLAYRVRPGAGLEPGGVAQESRCSGPVACERAQSWETW